MSLGRTATPVQVPALVGEDERWAAGQWVRPDALQRMARWPWASTALRYLKTIIEEDCARTGHGVGCVWTLGGSVHERCSLPTPEHRGRGSRLAAKADPVERNRAACFGSCVGATRVLLLASAILRVTPTRMRERLNPPTIPQELGPRFELRRDTLCGSRPSVLRSGSPSVVWRF